MSAPFSPAPDLAPPGLSPEGVRTMFGRIAERYDLGNRILSLGRDRAWRRRAARESDLRPGGKALDVCAGTGDLAFELERRGARVLALDFCAEMLRRGAAKASARRSAVRFVAGDALALPFAPRTFDAATIAFGLRNLADPRAGLAEMGRVLRPGGRLVVLEFTRPGGGPFAALFRAYARRVLPAVGGWITGRREAYEYLPRTLLRFGSPGELAAAVEAAGFEQVRCRTLTGGIVACVGGVRRP
ncbi:MAG TPA: bifunctional demethylmenaquinone methyltransferase/2-methoxy-6-polyprenyl-1,4-benzoquinol methylase UbiE [Planctomycetota bacterium]|nr:bifunctional demethylmenaquinone methyltransferase/2-methoxy-6-polyprenyl-1,4-benzoquinol methylase UbiE [Planctomycetota bacterium]